MDGNEFRAIRERLGLSKNQFAQELGYTGSSHNNTTLIDRYETGRGRQIPLYIARLAWLLERIAAYADSGSDIPLMRRDESGRAPLPAWPRWYNFEEDEVTDVDRG